MSISNLKTTLINNLEQVVKIQHDSSANNFIEMNIDPPKGFYFLKIETDEGNVITKEILKE